MDDSETALTELAALEERLGHHFSDSSLLRLALSHASLGELSNERLEFLGDRVLGLIVAEKLYEDFPKMDEGGLAVRLNALVRKESCARVAEAAELGRHLAMAASEQGSGGRRKAAILAGACEAVMAALYLDGGMEAARRFVLRYWREGFADLAPDPRDAKTSLQEWAQGGALPQRVQPVYALKSREGPDHAPVFTVEVTLPGHAAEAGTGASKREAEQDAARRMLLSLGVWKQ
jgi:ribonuclease-3